MEVGHGRSSGVQPPFRRGRNGSAGPPSATLNGTPTVTGDTMSLSRRDFTRQSALTGAGVALAGSVGALATAPNALASTETETATREAGHSHGGVGYGPLLPDPDGILALPAG